MVSQGGYAGLNWLGLRLHFLVLSGLLFPMAMGIPLLILCMSMLVLCSSFSQTWYTSEDANAWGGHCLSTCAFAFEIIVVDSG